MGRNKFGNKPITIDCINFPSKAEGSRYLQLKLMAQSGEITKLRVHPPFVIVNDFTYRGKKVRGITYVPDFTYLDLRDNELVAEDVKGRLTDVYKLKAKLFKKRYPKYRLVEVFM